ncbi:hypothetical protein [Streptomyces sp. M7]|uniref:hypothetical protein n=1 Tax=Streptomyces sp. M7 TaxID=255705 RepID=UPI000E1DEB1D|nr:hypothetical protein [Streptomyces sp. M7]RDS64411.1 hypothetical protein DWC19_16495 [Streptomyces sp. M7]
MSSGRRSLADHPVIVIITVVAAVVGLIVGVKELKGTDSAPPSAAAPTATDTDTTLRTPAATQVAPTQEEDMPTQDEEPEASEPAREPVTQPVEEEPSRAAVVQSPGHTAPLVVRIKLGSSGKTGPDSYRVGSRPGANTEVYDDTGRLDRGCYVQWTLSRGSEVVRRVTSGRCRPPSITLFNFEDSLDEPGSYTLKADVTTDWRQTGTESVTFNVVPG